MADDFFKIRKLYELKTVKRMNSVLNRKENPAEHSWSSIMLADYFLSNYRFNVDRLRVYELLMYHDVVEIESGDTPLGPAMKNNYLGQLKKEQKAKKILAKKLPKIQGKRFIKLFDEFEEMKTPESKFAKAMDKLDAIIHELDYKKDWQGWTEKFLRDNKEKYFKDFPELKKAFEEILEFLNKNGYLEKEK